MLGTSTTQYIKGDGSLVARVLKAGPYLYFFHSKMIVRVFNSGEINIC